MLLLLLLLLATSPWCLSELWGGGVPTLDIDHCRPRLRRLLLRSLLIGPAPPSPPAIWFPAYPAVAFCPGSARDHLTIRVLPVSFPSYEKPFARLSLIRHFQRLNLPFLPFPHHLPNSRRSRSHATAKIYFNVAFRCCYIAVCRHHGSWNLPPPSYPVSFAQNSKIGRRSTHSNTVVCPLLT